MGRRRVALAVFSVVGVVAMVPSSAMADRHTGDVGGGGGRAGRSDLKGVVLTGDWVPRGGNFGATDAHGLRELTWSVAGEFSYLSGDHEYGDRSGSLSQYTFQAGLRLTWNKPFGHRLQPFLVGLAGFTAEQDFRDETSFSLAGGAGADFRFSREHRLVLRVQQTWYRLGNGTSDDTYGQTSALVVYRFE